MIFRLLLYVMQGVSFIGNVLLFLCSDGCSVQSVLLFQPLLIFTMAFFAVEKLNHGGIKAACKDFDGFIRVAGFVRLLLFVQMVSSENQSSISCPRLRFRCGTFMVRSCLGARIFSKKLRTSSGARWSASR